jgi:malate dehydrogenase
MSRDDLLMANYEIVKTPPSRPSSTRPTHPDPRHQPARRHVLGRQQVSKFSKNRVIGMAGVLDTARLPHLHRHGTRRFGRNITALVLGGHGDTMVPSSASPPSAASPLPNCCPRTASTPSSTAPATAAPRS